MRLQDAHRHLRTCDFRRKFEPGHTRVQLFDAGDRVRQDDTREPVDDLDTVQEEVEA